MNHFLFTIQASAPVFILCFLGILLKKIRMIDDRFVEDSSRLVFTVAMPVLIFTKLSVLDISEVFSARLLIFVLTATTLCFLGIWWISARCVRGPDLGSFVQGAFRSNYAIVGFAVIVQAFGEEALGKAALILAVIMPLYNLLSVIVLSVNCCEEGIHWTETLRRVLTNPLILAAGFSLPFSIFRIDVPVVINRSANILAALTLPLALIGIGGTLNLNALRAASAKAFSASLIKTVIVPLLCCSVAIRLGFRGEELGVLYVLFAAPTAVASFVMAKTLGGNARLAGNIVLISTLAASVTMPIGLFIIRTLGYF